MIWKIAWAKHKWLCSKSLNNRKEIMQGLTTGQPHGWNHPVTCTEKFNATTELSNEVFENHGILGNIIFPDMGQRINVHPDRGPVSVTAIRFLGQITESNIQTTYSGTSTNSVSIAASLFKSEMCISAHFYPGLPKTCCLSKSMKETGCEVRQFAVEAKNTV